MPPESLRHLLSSASLRRPEVNRGIVAAMSIELAAKIFAEKLPAVVAPLVHPIAWRNGTLRVSCDHSTATQEVRLREVDLIAALNAAMGTNLVKRIILR